MSRDPRDARANSARGMHRAGDCAPPPTTRYSRLAHDPPSARSRAHRCPPPPPVATFSPDVYPDWHGLVFYTFAAHCPDRHPLYPPNQSRKVFPFRYDVSNNNDKNTSHAFGWTLRLSSFYKYPMTRPPPLFTVSRLPLKPANVFRSRLIDNFSHFFLYTFIYLFLCISFFFHSVFALLPFRRFPWHLAVAFCGALRIRRRA